MIAKLFAKYQSIGLITLSLLAGAIMTFIALPVLTRLYSVADFGAYGIALAIVSILSTVAIRMTYVRIRNQKGEN